MGKTLRQTVILRVDVSWPGSPKALLFSVQAVRVVSILVLLGEKPIILATYTVLQTHLYPTHLNFRMDYEDRGSRS